MAPGRRCSTRAPPARSALRTPRPASPATRISGGRPRLPDTGQPHQREADTVHLPMQRRLCRSRRRRVDTAAGRNRGVQRRPAQPVPKTHASVRSDVVAGGEQARLFGRGNATLEDRGGLVVGQRVRGTGRDGGHHVRRRRDELTVESHGALHARGTVDLGHLVLHQRLEHVAVGEDAVLPVVAHPAVGQEEGACGRQPAAVGKPSNQVAAGAAVRSARTHRQLLAAMLLEAQLGAGPDPHAAGQVLWRRRAARRRRLEQRVGTTQRGLQPLLGHLSHLIRRVHAVHDLDEAGESRRHATSPRAHAALAVQCALADRAEQHVQRGRGLMGGARSRPLHRRVAKARRTQQRPARRRLGDGGLQLEVEDRVRIGAQLWAGAEDVDGHRRTTGPEQQARAIQRARAAVQLHPERRHHQHQLRPAPQVLDIAEDEAQQCSRGGVFEAILIRDGYDGARVQLGPGVKAAEGGVAHAVRPVCAGPKEPFA
eukprot:scaffold46411_cov68-Phaeocystis_antarctica.AAC.11